MVKQAVFPTLLYTRELVEAEEINAELLEMIRAERERDGKGVQRSNVRALGGWHSKSDLQARPEYKRITRKVMNQAALIAKDLEFSTEHEMRIKEMWSIVNGPGSFNKSHVHPGSIWSGVYYVQAPEGSGNISFTDPRTPNIMLKPRFEKGKKRKQECMTKISITPTAGKMIFFPSWLYHAVDVNLSEEAGEAAERVIISFNLSQVKRRKTSKS